MKKILATITLWLALLIQPAAAGQVLYLAATNAQNITVYSIDEGTGKLEVLSSIDLPGKAGPLTYSPDRKLIYAAVTGLEDGKAGVATLQRAPDGSLKLLGTAHIASRAPYIRVDNTGKFLLAAHYGAGEVTSYRIRQGVCTEELLNQIVTARTAHCIELDPSGQFAFVPHTTPNRVYQFRLDRQSGKLIANEPPFAEGPDEDHQYHQPRHYVHHPTLDMAYTSNERGGGISVWKFDPKSGTLQRVQTLSTLPDGYQGSSAAADIQITSDGRFVYVSNRDTNKAGGQATQDSLAAFVIDEKTGRVERIGTFPTVHFPRSFCIDHDNKYVYAAGQRSSRLAAYRILASGGLERLKTFETGETPIWVMTGLVE